MIPRRNQLDQLKPAEIAIRVAILVVEQLPADTRLTDAVVLLQEAQKQVADFIDGIRGDRPYIAYLGESV